MLNKTVSLGVLLLVLIPGWSWMPARADEPDVDALRQRVLAAAGGEERLLRLFRIKERLNVSSDPEKPGNERVSVLEPPKYWWLGKRERVREDKEPAIFLVWGWTLGALASPESKLEPIAEIADGEGKVFGLRVSGSVEPPMDLYFDQQDNRLLRIDWRNDIHRFSDWREHEDIRYPAKCVGYRKAIGKPWYFTEILELQRLQDLPPGLSRSP